MNRYVIKLKLDNGDIVEAAVTATNRSDALKRLVDTIEYKAFAKDKIAQLESIEEVGESPIDNMKYSVSESLARKGWYVVCDLYNDIEVEFEKGRYNETKEIRFGKQSKLSPLEQATALREIGEFMYCNFKNIACKKEK